MTNQYGFVKSIVFLMLFAIIGYMGYKFALPYYNYFAIKFESSAIARLNFLNNIDNTGKGAHGDENMVFSPFGVRDKKSLDKGPGHYRGMVYEKAVSLNLPINPEDIIVEILDNKVRITTEWIEEVNLLGYYTIPFHFSLDVEEEVAKKDSDF